MTDKYFRDWATIIRRSIYEAISPLLGGGLWVLAAWWQNSSLLAALSGFGIGYLFVLSVQAQVLRIAKNVRDETDADEFKNSFATIHEALSEIKYRTTVGASHSVPAPRRRMLDTFKPHIQQAEEAIRSGLIEAGTLAAAVAFEQAVRNAAQGLSLDPKQPLSSLIDSLGPYINDPDFYDRLKSLLKMRNGLIHRSLTIGDANSAEYLLQSFQQAIERLNAIKK